MALNTRAIFTEVAGLVMTPVKLRDLDNIPQEAIVRDLPLLFPDPDQAVADSKSQRLTFGTALTAGWEDFTILRWRYLHAAVGEGRGLKDYYPSFIVNLDIIKTAFLEGAYATSNAVSKQLVAREFGTVNGPNNKKYYGTVLEVLFWQQIHP